jgi:hypothetical protein
MTAVKTRFPVICIQGFFLAPGFGAVEMLLKVGHQQDITEVIARRCCFAIRFLSLLRRIEHEVTAEIAECAESSGPRSDLGVLGGEIDTRGILGHSAIR